MIKKYTVLCLFTFLYVSSIAQNTTVTTQTILNPQPVFFGGGIVLGGGSGSFQIGLNPEMVKSYNQYIDLGLAFNLYYSSFRTPASISGERYKSSNSQIGFGGFMRAWPIEQFFLQIQPEYNWTFSNANNLTQGTHSQLNADGALENYMEMKCNVDPLKTSDYYNNLKTNYQNHQIYQLLLSYYFLTPIL